MMDWIKKTVSVVMLVVYATLFVSTNLFYHSHHLGDKVVFHSHLFGGQQHTHSSDQIQAIDLITSAVIYVVEPDQLPLVYEGKPQDITCLQPVRPLEKAPIIHFFLRAPPTLFC